MKKILFASTAMVAFAGAASAEVTLTGFAEMGLFVGDGGVADTGGDVEFFTDIDVTFTMAGETDGGLIFGATVDLDEGGDGSDASDNNTDDGGATIFISGGFGTVTLGDTDGALDWALTEVNFASGSINDDETEHGGFSGNSGLDGAFDGNILRYDYSVANFGVAASLELDDEGDEENFSFGVRYELTFAGAEVNLGAGYQDAGPGQAYGLSVAANLANGLSLGVNYTEFDDVVDGDSLADIDRHFGIGAGYSVGAISLSANYGIFQGDDGDNEGFGLSAGYDLGGGASLQAGYGNTDNDNGDDFETFSFGVRMNF